MHITECNYFGIMTLAEKIRNLRAIEGSLRGFGRPMTQEEVSKAMRKQLGKTVSQSYLSQIESGGRPHLTHTTRTLLARFFGVYPGFLVNDPEGYHTELLSELRVREATLDSWLLGGAERFQSDPELSAALLAIAEVKDSRRPLLLLREILRTPGLLDRLEGVLHPAQHEHVDS
jgi:transcriptional regulator with XRE-family HTH domain